MTDTTDLIQRLRTAWTYCGVEQALRFEAAAALEQQAAELDALKRDIESLLPDLTAANVEIEQQAAQIEALRADAERLRRVSDAAAVYYEHYMQDEADSPEYCVCGDEQHQRAVEVRDSLAALRQEQPT